LQGRLRRWPWPIFVTQMLTRDLFAIANLHVQVHSSGNDMFSHVTAMTVNMSSNKEYRILIKVFFLSRPT